MPFFITFFSFYCSALVTDTDSFRQSGVTGHGDTRIPYIINYKKSTPPCQDPCTATATVLVFFPVILPIRTPCKKIPKSHRNLSGCFRFYHTKVRERGPCTWWSPAFLDFSRAVHQLLPPGLTTKIVNSHQGLLRRKIVKKQKGFNPCIPTTTL